MLDILNFSNSNLLNLFFIYSLIGRRNHLDGWNYWMREISFIFWRVDRCYFLSFCSGPNNRISYHRYLAIGFKGLDKSFVPSLLFLFHSCNEVWLTEKRFSFFFWSNKPHVCLFTIHFFVTRSIIVTSNDIDLVIDWLRSPFHIGLGMRS